MRPPYLTGPRIYLRPLLVGDREHAAAWSAGPFPVDATQAEAFIRAEAPDGWAPPARLHLAIARLDGDEVVGGATVDGPGQHACEVAVRAAPWLPDADAVRVEALRLLVPWLRDEVEMMTVTVAFPADEPALIAAADAMGMVRQARLREHVIRPDGRVDLLLYQALNPRREVPRA